MIRWCAYCQRYQGEVAPFDDYRMTHTICAACEARDAFHHAQPASLASIQAFFGRVAGSALEQRQSARELVAEGAALGLDSVDLLLGVVQPVLHQLGDRWARGEVSIAEEHRVTALCSAVIDLIVEGDPSVASLRQARSPAVLLVLAEGNHHTLGAQILEVFLLKHRISTHTIHPGLPAEEIVELARMLRPRVIAISAALPEQIPSAAAVAARVAHWPPGERPRVVVGGLALRERTGPELGDSLLACRDLEALRELAGAGAE